MKTLLSIVLVNLFVAQFALANLVDTHSQLCSNIRDKVSENCSSEPNTFDKETGKDIKRTYEECVEQDLPSTVSRVSELLEEEGVLTYTYDDESNITHMSCAAIQ